jgi:hypothetical protein
MRRLIQVHRGRPYSLPVGSAGACWQRRCLRLMHRRQAQRGGQIRIPPRLRPGQPEPAHRQDRQRGQELLLVLRRGRHPFTETTYRKGRSGPYHLALRVRRPLAGRHERCRVIPIQSGGRINCHGQRYGQALGRPRARGAHPWDLLRLARQSSGLRQMRGYEVNAKWRSYDHPSPRQAAHKTDRLSMAMIRESHGTGQLQRATNCFGISRESSSVGRS